MTSDQPPVSVSTDIREVLFGDELLEKVATYGEDALVGSPACGKAPQGAQTNPWPYFTAASQHQAEGDRPRAIASLQKILQMRGLEVRIYLQAWHCLRALDQQPPPDLAREAQGVVVEVALGDGLDIVVAYADGSARYINYSGAAILWDVHDVDIDKLVAELLGVGQSLVEVSDPWDGPRPPAPPTGSVRINVLTYGGLHFGQGTFKVITQDGLGGLALRGAFDLMQALLSRVKK